MIGCDECELAGELCEFHLWNEVPMNYWPLFSFRMELSELRYTDETQTAVKRVRFDETLDVRAWSRDRAVETVRLLNSFRGTKLEKLFQVVSRD